MKPQNKKERASAFYKVIGLFVICMVIALLLGFTLMDFNSLSNNKSSKDLNKIKADMEYQEENFTPSIEELNSKIESIAGKIKQSENADQDLADLPASITTIKSGIPEEHNWKDFYNNILKTYSDLHVALKEQVRIQNEMGNLESRSSGSGEEAIRLRADNTRLQTELNSLKASGGANSEYQKKYELSQLSVDSLKNAIEDLEFLVESKDAEINRLKK